MLLRRNQKPQILCLVGPNTNSLWGKKIDKIVQLGGGTKNFLQMIEDSGKPIRGKCDAVRKIKGRQKEGWNDLDELGGRKNLTR